jgi:Uma2 family endonuclease
LSWQEYLHLEDPPGFRLEFDEGRLIVSPTGVSRHQWLIGLLQAAFDEYEERTGGAHCVATLDVSHFMPRGERDFRPDVGVVLAARRSAIDPNGFVQGAPDIAVEVLSPRTRRYDLGEKARKYFEQGTVEYWQFDVESERAVFLRRGLAGWKESRLARRHVYVTPLLPGFKLDLKRLWARLARKTRSQG